MLAIALLSFVAPLIQSPLTGVEEAKLTATDATAGDELGHSVAASFGVALVGSPHDDDAGSSSGSAYIFERSGSGWIEQAKLTAGDANLGDQFGYSVAADYETAVVGARFAGSPGAAYVFVRSPVGTSWSEQAKLTTMDAGVSGLGSSVSLYANTVVVGAPQDSGSTGSAYVFVRSGTSWSEQARLIAGDASGGDNFGAAVAVYEDALLVGAPGNDDGGESTGSAYVFIRNGTSWNEQAKVVASDGVPGAVFGESVSLSVDTALVGARGDNDGGSSSGAAYVFARNGAAWFEEVKLEAGDEQTNDRFGSSVSLHGNLALIGASGSSHTNGSEGAAYVFSRSGTSWSEHLKLVASDAATSDFFGRSVSVVGNTAVVGADFDDDAGNSSGSAYAFEVGRAAFYVLGDICTGDGGDQLGCTDCPCSNNAPVGTISGCKHSQSDALFGGRGARLLVTQDSGILPEELCLELMEAKPSSFAILVSGPSAAPNPAGVNPCAIQNPGSGIAQPMLLDGLRCVISGGLGPVLRHGSRAVDAAGYVGVNGVGPEARWGYCSPSFPNSFFTIGETRHFQAIYREDPGAGCDTGQNTSQGLTIVFGIELKKV